MKTKCFLSGSAEEPTISDASLPSNEPVREIVKLHITGSLRGIASITHALHHLRFAEVNDWGKPQPTGKPGEYVTVLTRHVLLQ